MNYLIVVNFFLESRAKPLQQKRVDNKGVFFICAIGINGGSLLNPIPYCWKIEDVRQEVRTQLDKCFAIVFRVSFCRPIWRKGKC